MEHLYSFQHGTPTEELGQTGVEAVRDVATALSAPWMEAAARVVRRPVWTLEEGADKGDCNLNDIGTQYLNVIMVIPYFKPQDRSASQA